MNKDILNRFIVKDEKEGWKLIIKELENEISNIILDDTKVIVYNGMALKVLDEQELIEDKDKKRLLVLTERYIYALERLENSEGKK